MLILSGAVTVINHFTWLALRARNKWGRTMLLQNKRDGVNITCGV
jgi:hypothetical protein